MSITKKVLFLVIGWVLLLIPAIILIEILFGGWIIEDEWKEAIRINVLRNYKTSIYIRNRYPHERQTVIYKRDENGLRMDCEGVENIDILTVGGSTTVQRDIHFEDTYQTILGRKLSDALDKKICIANAGIDGHSTYGHLLSFKHWFPLIKGLQPTHILFYIGINDANFHRLEMGRRYSNLKPRTLGDLIIAKSAIYNFFKDSIYAIRYDGRKVAHGRLVSFKPDQYTVTTLTPGVARIARQNALFFRNRLQRLVEHTERLGAKAICVTQPHKLTKNGKGIQQAFEYKGKTYNGLDYDYAIRLLNVQIRQVCGDKNFIDLYHANLTSQDFVDYVHTTNKGAEKVATLLYGAYLKLGLVKDFSRAYKQLGRQPTLSGQDGRKAIASR